MQSKYPAKILLFGEYSVISGSPALAIPLFKFFGHWEYSSGVDRRLVDFLKWIDTHGAGADLEFQRLIQAVEGGLTFASNIPHGCGLGSSGALVAAIWDCYSKKEATVEWDALRSKLAALEAYFHGESSGLDPLISCVQSPVEITPDGNAVPFFLDNQPSPLQHMYLLDSDQPRNTAALVELFRQKRLDAQFEKQLKEVLTPAVISAITALKHQSYTSLDFVFRSISRFEWTHFKPMIPPSIRPLWERGLSSGDYHIKLCGAGGGGFCLVHCRDIQQLDHALRDRLLPLI